MKYDIVQSRSGDYIGPLIWLGILVYIFLIDIIAVPFLSYYLKEVLKYVLL